MTPAETLTLRQAEFDRLIDSLLSSLTAPPEEFDPILQQAPAITRNYREALLQTATAGTGEETDLNDKFAQNLTANLAFLISNIALHRTRKGYA